MGNSFDKTAPKSLQAGIWLARAGGWLFQILHYIKRLASLQGVASCSSTAYRLLRKRRLVQKWRHKGRQHRISRLSATTPPRLAPIVATRDSTKLNTSAPPVATSKSQARTAANGTSNSSFIRLVIGMAPSPTKKASRQGRIPAATAKPHFATKGEKKPQPPFSRKRRPPLRKSFLRLSQRNWQVRATERTATAQLGEMSSPSRSGG